ncbi:MAG: glycoside hydrolase family 2, partial [Gemmatimonadetes bacterium]|nr:glycoside hydrolase family 2 [Gemmatimonadota bacterium]
MRHIDLNGQWKLQYGKQEIPAMELDSPRIPQDFTMVDALVPGNVELDLMRAGHLPAQLERGNNIYDLRPLESYQWWYSRSFTIAAQDRGRAFELVLEGVDTLATIWLNGQRIATLQNMLIPHRVLMDDLLQAGENHLVIGIDSVIQAAAKRPVAPGEWAMENNWESLNIRKAAHGFGWDIMPRVISAGLWRDVYIEEKDPTRFSNVYLTTTSVNVTDKKAGLLVRWDLQATQYPMDGWTVCLSVKDPATGGSVFEKCVPVLSSHGHAAGEVEGIELWWPRGYGRPALYDISLEARDDTGGCRAEWIGRHGFRIARLEKTATTNAAGDGKFEFEVNGQRVFVKGTNWVPLDALHSRDTQHLDAALDMLVDLNCNMVRCWGGNVYEGEDFFSRCDKEGIMVWQDFAFGCALYPQTPSFHEKVRREAEAIIPMLRNHPSLVLWAGN